MSATDPHPSDEEWDALACDLCGGRPVTLCAGMCSHYCDDHGPDDVRADREVCTCASAYGNFIGCKLHGIEADGTNREDGSAER